jgi:phosphoribosylamine--glycine ligase
VIKADGLAAGKGVFVCRTQAEVDSALPRALAFGADVVIEELLAGEEVSLFALTDGVSAVALPPAQDAKRLRDGDEGPNTGGMGAYSPVPFVDTAQAEELAAAVHRPVLAELGARGTSFVGLLYAGLMLTDDGPRVLEFNCRFGDPETQVILPLLSGDLLEALAAAAAGAAPEAALAERSDAAVTVVLTGPDYPERSDYTGAAITGIAAAEQIGALVFHGGTAVRGDALVTNGGRILSVTAVGADLAAARERAYAAAATIQFDGVRYRTDIGSTVSV